ncbi:MAG: hypothetical protein H6654_03595 [Ardenticatenaceae bacterium]|nr:hypothetical protein [Ardenticatenaceae bacterium]
MTETEITFQNNAEIRVQAQIFAENELVSTCIADPGESPSMPINSAHYDIYCKNGITGWRIAYKLDSDAKTLTLSKSKGSYIIM